MILTWPAVNVITYLSDREHLTSPSGSLRATSLSKRPGSRHTPSVTMVAGTVVKEAIAPSAAAMVRPFSSASTYTFSSISMGVRAARQRMEVITALTRSFV